MDLNKKTIIFNDPNSEPPKNWIWQKNNSHYVYNHSLRKWVESDIAYPFIEGLKQILSYNDDEPPKNYLWYKNDSILKYEYDKWKSNDSEHDYSKDYFTIEALESGTIKWDLCDKTVQYSKNGGSWETMDSETTISVVAGDKVQLKGTNTNYNGNTISVTTQFNVYGNIMSLTNGDEFESANTVSSNGFNNLFSRCTYLISASDLKLPATTLADSCYGSMFGSCTCLTAAPELPATTLTLGCYNSMFGSCTSLTSAPVLPATTLANNCYRSMFQGCTSLTTAPELPATILVQNCYNYMFMGCTSLNYIKCLATDISASNCTNNWVNGVASSGTFVKNASMPRENWRDGNSGIPTGWTVQDAS